VLSPLKPVAAQPKPNVRKTLDTSLVEAAVEETRAYYTFPEEHWRRIRTNSPPEGTVAGDSSQ